MLESSVLSNSLFLLQAICQIKAIFKKIAKFYEIIHFNPFIRKISGNLMVALGSFFQHTSVRNPNNSTTHAYLKRHTNLCVDFVISF